MLTTGFLSLQNNPADTISPMLYFGIFLLGASSPSMGLYAFAPFWAKVTPIKNRSTYIENEIVFIGSTLIGLSAALAVWFQIPIFYAVKTSAFAVMIALPALFLIWLAKSTLSPLRDLDTSADVASAQSFRDETPYFWNNALAYILSGVVSSFVFTLIFFLVITLNDGTFATAAGWKIFPGMMIANTIAAPIYIWIGRKLRPQDTNPRGLHYTLGGILFVSFILCLSLPNVFRSTLDVDGHFGMGTILKAWPFAVAYILLILSYVGGGIVFSKFYKSRPPYLEFA